jgi:hypothetical protein
MSNGPGEQIAADVELYVLLRKAGEDRHEAQALIDRHRDTVLSRVPALTPCTHIKALHETEHVGLIVEGCSWCVGREQLGTPGHTKPLVHVTSTGVRPGLNSAERAMLRYALDLAEDEMASKGDEFAAVDYAAVESLKQLAGEE